MDPIKLLWHKNVTETSLPLHRMPKKYFQAKNSLKNVPLNIFGTFLFIES